MSANNAPIGHKHQINSTGILNQHLDGILYIYIYIYTNEVVHPCVCDGYASVVFMY